MVEVGREKRHAAHQVKCSCVAKLVRFKVGTHGREVSRTD